MNTATRMTSLSQYMDAEEYDPAEPASFYLTGDIDGWGRRSFRQIHGARHRRIPQELPPWSDEDETQEEEE